MNRHITFFSLGLLGLVATASGATIALVNPGFELPNTVKILSGFDSATDIPGWKNNGGTYGDSGVETSVGHVNAVGGWNGYLQSQDGGAYQASSYTIATGDSFTLDWVAGATSNGARNTAMLVTLFRTTDGGATRTVIATSNALLGGTTNTFQSYTLGYTATAADAGAQIGVEFDYNVGTGNYAGFDNFALSVVPEPSAALLAALGVLGLVKRRR